MKGTVARRFGGPPPNNRYFISRFLLPEDDEASNVVFSLQTDAASSPIMWLRH